MKPIRKRDWWIQIINVLWAAGITIVSGSPIALWFCVANYEFLRWVSELSYYGN